SSPGHCSPTPSPAQNVPNPVSIIPTTNFSVFSGTRLNGLCTTTAAPVTSTAASTEPSSAGLISPAVSPNVITINTTSSPSSSTPLKATVNAVQSMPWPLLTSAGMGTALNSATSR